MDHPTLDTSVLQQPSWHLGLIGGNILQQQYPDRDDVELPKLLQEADAVFGVEESHHRIAIVYFTYSLVESRRNNDSWPGPTHLKTFTLSLKPNVSLLDERTPRVVLTLAVLLHSFS
ncbi:UNVERIFIED_CONTAM: hypothetical protein Sradi_6565900 [Sesamum radiatum]|uniref:Uncharacterized protein n=1 Tax=Sesamum radiatum TaxID=300843 RepID=A0AAW2JXJ4_SESRA